jgi:hypothetical protein
MHQDTETTPSIEVSYLLIANPSVRMLHMFLNKIFECSPFTGGPKRTQQRMDFFPLSLKLYHMWGENAVRLGIKASSSSVLTFYFEAPEFKKMIEDCFSHHGYDSHGYFVLVKDAYVRFSKQGDSFTTHLRIDPFKWKKLIEDYKRQVENPTGDYFSCEIL